MTAQQRAKIFKALSDERRVDIVDSLAKHGSRCGTQLAEELGITLSLLCHHWEVLVDAGVVKKERVGQLRICTLDAARLRQATGSWDAGIRETPSQPRARTKPAASTKPRSKSAGLDGTKTRAPKLPAKKTRRVLAGRTR